MKTETKLKFILSLSATIVLLIPLLINWQTVSVYDFVLATCVCPLVTWFTVGYGLKKMKEEEIKK